MRVYDDVMAAHLTPGRKAVDADQPKERVESRHLPRAPFRVEPHDFGFDPRLDLDKALQIADELECIEATKKLGS
jgi:hypothetical protein